MSVEAVSILIQQESPKTGNLSNALAVLIGCYGQKGFSADIKEWTGKVLIKLKCNAHFGPHENAALAMLWHTLCIVSSDNLSLSLSLFHFLSTQ